MVFIFWLPLKDLKNLGLRGNSAVERAKCSRKPCTRLLCNLVEVQVYVVSETKKQITDWRSAFCLAPPEGLEPSTP